MKLFHTVRLNVWALFSRIYCEHARMQRHRGKEGRCPQVGAPAAANSPRQRCQCAESSGEVPSSHTHTHTVYLTDYALAEEPGSLEHLETSKERNWTRARPCRWSSEPLISMFSWVKQEQGGRNKEGEMYQTVTEGLQSLYTKKLLPLEETYLFHDFHSPALEAADFQSKPMVLLVGQYSTGKTTFIRYLAAPSPGAVVQYY